MFLALCYHSEITQRAQVGWREKVIPLQSETLRLSSGSPDGFVGCSVRNPNFLMGTYLVLGTDKAALISRVKNLAAHSLIS